VIKNDSGGQMLNVAVGQGGVVSLEDECREFLSRATTNTVDAHLADQGRILADRLHLAATELGYNKATEFSPDIERFILLAAEVALLAYDPSAPELERFERDVFYYKSFQPPHRIVEEYIQFKALHRRRNS
jgi:hypothetical protein